MATTYSNKRFKDYPKFLTFKTFASVPIETFHDWVEVRSGPVREGDLVADAGEKTLLIYGVQNYGKPTAETFRGFSFYVFRDVPGLPKAKRCPKTKAPPPKQASGALTYDSGKEPLATLPWAALDELARVQAYGHKKYGDFNNYRKGMEVTRNLSCALRHIRDYINGSNNDKESGCHPLGHALARIAFVLQNINDKTAVDDRFIPAPIT